MTSVPPASQSTVGEMFDGYAQDWDRFYQEGEIGPRSYDYRNRQQRALQLAAELVPRSGRVLEFGCGAGHTGVQLAKLGFQMTCLDISEQMVVTTRRTFEAAGHTAEFHHGVIEDAPLAAGSFDAVTAMGVMEYVPDPQRTIARAAELLKPGGVCILSFTNSATPMRWIEMPIKRSLAFALYAVTRKSRYYDVAFPASRANRRGQVDPWYQAAGLTDIRAEYYSLGFRLGNLWFPPLALVRNRDRALARTRFAGLCRGFFMIGRKPQ